MSQPVLKTGGHLAPVRPQSFEDAQRMAKVAVAAGLYPKAAWNEEETSESAVAKATMAIMQGLECGVPPMQAVQNIAIINGRAMMYGDLLTALLWSKGFKVKKWTEGEGDNRVGKACITRPDGEKIEKAFSVADAKRANLWDERKTVKRKRKNEWVDAPNDSPWFKYEYRMLEWRAFGFCVKDGASDATHGMLVHEEASPEANTTVVDITPDDDTGVLMPPPMPEEASQDIEEENPNQGFFDMLESKFSECDSEEDVAELRKSFEVEIGALNEADKAHVEAILGVE